MNNTMNKLQKTYNPKSLYLRPELLNWSFVFVCFEGGYGWLNFYRNARNKKSTRILAGNLLGKYKRLETIVNLSEADFGNMNNERKI
jgi:hypothetical protein